MYKKLILLCFISPLLLLQGCAGGLIVIAGSAVAVNSDERSISTQLSDDALALTVLDKINSLNLNNKEMRINIITNNSYLLLVGQVTDQKTKNLIEQELNNIKEIKSIYNQLRISAPISLLKLSQDSWITTKVKSQLTAHDEVDSFKIKVVTEDAEVFLIGRVDTRTADLATNITRKVSGVKQVNRVLQIIPENAK